MAEDGIGAQRGPSVLNALRSARVVPVVEIANLDQAKPLFEALAAAGLPIAEITLRTDVAVETIALLRHEYPDAVVGAGTVLSTEDVRRVADAGANFVVSPATNPEVIALCFSLGVFPLPGTCTPTDVDIARRAGTRLVKFFPAEAMGGIRVIKALAGPFADVAFVPTGGINACNLGDYLRLPQVVACGGSWMVAPRLIRESRFDEVEKLTREAVLIAKEMSKNG